MNNLKANNSTNMKIWVDLDNSPHVPFFFPIIKELEKRGYSVLVTSRDCFQVCGLAEYYNLSHKKIGKHYGANKIMKVIGTVLRSMFLAPYILRNKPDLSVSHGSRSLILVSSLFKIPSILLFDYEHASGLPFFKADIGIVPEVINHRDNKWNFRRGMRAYSGLKEDVYVSSFRPNPDVLKELGIRSDELVATIRPPANEAHYHNPESEQLFLETVNFIGTIPDSRMVILPRNEITQKELIKNTWPEWCQSGKIIIPRKVVNGLDLIWYSDLVVSGGGTMNREAAALGVPVYSIFRGTIGAVDKYLAEKGRLTLIECVDDVRAKIKVKKRDKNNSASFQDLLALNQIVEAIEDAVHPSN